MSLRSTSSLALSSRPRLTHLVSLPLQNDGYSLYYPNGMNSSMNKAAIKLMKVRSPVPLPLVHVEKDKLVAQEQV